MLFFAAVVIVAGFVAITAETGFAFCAVLFAAAALFFAVVLSDGFLITAFWTRFAFITVLFCAVVLFFAVVLAGFLATTCFGAQTLKHWLLQPFGYKTAAAAAATACDC